MAVANDSVPGTNGTVSVLMGRDDGTLQSPRLYRTGSRPTAVAIGDLDGNRKPDLATSNLFGNSVSVLLNRGDGSFRAKRDYRTPALALAIALGDLNGDRRVDVAAAGGGGVSVLLNTTRPS